MSIAFAKARAMAVESSFGRVANMGVPVAIGR